MDMTRPELLTTFRQIERSYATPLVNEPMPHATEPRIRSSNRDGLLNFATLSSRISDKEAQFDPGKRRVHYLRVNHK